MKRLSVLVALTIGLGAPHAGADCTPASHLSTCIDADTFWPHAGPATFAFIGGTDTTAPGQIGLGLVTTYLGRPVVLQIPSSDLAGNEIDAVHHLVDATFLWSYGLTGRAELTVALSTTAYRTGSGVSSLASQSPEALARTALRDSRVGAAYALLGRLPDRRTDPFGLKARLELSLPTGDESSFAGDRSVVEIPSFAFDFRRGLFVAAAELGARLRQTSDLLGASVGPQLFAGLGAGVYVIRPEVLSVLLEAFALPTLSDQRREAYDATGQRRVELSTGRALVPSEWAASIRSAPFESAELSISLAAGGRLGLAGEPALTAPTYRFALGLRYAPVAR